MREYYSWSDCFVLKMVQDLTENTGVWTRGTINGKLTFLNGP